LAASAADARFLEIDPAGYKGDQNLYTYVGNDPPNKVDPTGKVIQLSDPAQARYFEKLINSTAQGTYRFDKSGRLVRTGSQSQAGGRHSGTYAKSLDRIIANGATLTLNKAPTISSGSGRISVDDMAGGGVTVLRAGNRASTTISGNSGIVIGANGQLMVAAPNVIMAHEIYAHADAWMFGPHFGAGGNAIADENVIRSELGLPLRDTKEFENEIGNVGK
jgi:uncharacterized protein RhaS with RHS repeats